MGFIKHQSTYCLLSSDYHEYTLCFIENSFDKFDFLVFKVSELFVKFEMLVYR